jgi:hypothetical protein
LTDEEMLSNLVVFEYSQAPLHVTFWLLYALALHPEEEKKVSAARLRGGKIKNLMPMFTGCRRNCNSALTRNVHTRKAN